MTLWYRKQCFAGNANGIYAIHLARVCGTAQDYGLGINLIYSDRSFDAKQIIPLMQNPILPRSKVIVEVEYADEGIAHDRAVSTAKNICDLLANPPKPTPIDD